MLQCLNDLIIIAIHQFMKESIVLIPDNTPSLPALPAFASLPPPTPPLPSAAFSCCAFSLAFLASTRFFQVGSSAVVAAGCWGGRPGPSGDCDLARFRSISFFFHVGSRVGPPSSALDAPTCWNRGCCCTTSNRFRCFPATGLTNDDGEGAAAACGAVEGGGPIGGV